MDLTALIVSASEWMTTDPDPATRAATARMLEEQDEAGLRRCFGRRLSFGTAGIRGNLGPGPGCMNRALVRRVSGGLATYLLAHGTKADERGVVVGFDGRHGSREFATDTAAILASHGIPVLLFPSVVATPVLAFAVTDQNCAAGVMVTASHNPPQDNGYKVYWSNGAQIIPPHDHGISAHIDKAPPVVQLASLSHLVGDGLVRTVPAVSWKRYQEAVLALRVRPPSPDAARALTVVYTALHGVGHAPLARLLKAAGHAPLHVVEAQRDPNPAFPTVRFPNPEEPGSLDLAKALGRDTKADLIIANDPDGDRMAVALPDPDEAKRGHWRRLSGNEVGLLLADELLRHGPDHPDRLVATTIVSTSRLDALAQIYGARYAETLTGFKWIANRAIAHHGPFVIGFEEALGYSIGDVVRDKDGLSAALIVMDLAAQLKAEGQTLLDRLADVYRLVGCTRTRQYAVTLPGEEGKAQIEATMAALRANPPKAIAGTPVIRTRDLLTGVARDLSTGKTARLDLPKSNVLAFELSDGCSVLARPSGTEPKIKLYFEACTPLGPDEELARAEARADLRIDALMADTLDRTRL